MLFLVTGGYVTIFGVHKLEQDEKPYTGVSTNGDTPKSQNGSFIMENPI